MATDTTQSVLGGLIRLMKRLPHDPRLNEEYEKLEQELAGANPASNVVKIPYCSHCYTLMVNEAWCQKEECYGRPQYLTVPVTEDKAEKGT